MGKNKFDLHDERLGTTDETGHRVYLYPEDIKGIWRTRRTQVYWFLIFIFLVLPWIHFHGKQIILLDLPARKFQFFGSVFYAHDAPLILLVLLGFVFSMGLVTAIFGRLWCGWTCPQTVFIDAIYRTIEKFVEGGARQRQKLDAAPLNSVKLFKKLTKWGLWLIVSMHIAHSTMGYFVGTRELFEMSLHSPSENWTQFTIMLFLTTLFLFNFGWFREQFCIIACPYGRMQSVMMDENSAVVAYDYNRGEPRKAKEVSKDQQGDCVNCYACVKACPTGIDIRRGTQLECIACTNCIDACDEIMEKVKKPSGLIRYTSANELEGKPVKKFGFRRGVYLTAIIAVITIFTIVVRKSFDVKGHLLRANKTAFKTQTLKDGSTIVLNHYKLTLDYKYEDKKKVTLSVDDKNIELVTPLNPYKLRKGHQKVNIFFKFGPDVLKKGTKKVKLTVKDLAKDIPLFEKEVTLVGPIK